MEYARKIGMKVVHIPLVLSDDYKEFGNGEYGLRAVIPQVNASAGTIRTASRFTSGHFAEVDSDS